MNFITIILSFLIKLTFKNISWDAYYKYEKEPQNRCQNGKDFDDCQTMIYQKKIGSCYDKHEGIPCFGEYYWIDDLGFQVKDIYYGNYTINYYPRSIIFEKKRWNVSIIFNETTVNYTDLSYDKAVIIDQKYPKEKIYMVNKYNRLIKILINFLFLGIIFYGLKNLLYSKFPRNKKIRN